MYLSRLRLEPYRVRKALSSPQVMHGSIEEAFEGKSVPSSKRRKLWRLDKVNGQLYLLVCSHMLPRSVCPDNLGGELVTWETIEYEPFLSRLRMGQRWYFRLKANPVYSISQGAGKPGKKYGHVTVDQQKSWLLSRTDSHGFSILPCESTFESKSHKSDSYQFDVVERAHLRFKKSGNAKPVELSVATFEGVLEVCDAVALRQALCNGVGRGKAYGCGLLTLASAFGRRQD